jgi:hypothetical protein
MEEIDMTKVLALALAGTIVAGTAAPAFAQTFGDWQRKRPTANPPRTMENGVCKNTRAGCIAGGVRRGFSREAAIQFCETHNNGCN